MNEWDRLHRMVEYYKAEYPSGTRIMLLSMDEDGPSMTAFRM